jgi:murein DD-endopeptidase MepM/ murein hydrolase activator NlpD
MKKKRTKKDKIKMPEFINFRFIGALIIVGIAIFLKFNPIYFNKTISLITKTNCDYTLLLSDIKKTVYAHTVGGKVFIKPVNDIITSPFGKRSDPLNNSEDNHTGIDINAKENTEVKSAYSGKVLRVEENEFYGKFIMIEHFDSLVSLYGHLNEQKVNVGDTVEKGDIIGLSGSTGRSTGPHLHFEIRKDGKCVDSSGYLI